VGSQLGTNIKRGRSIFTANTGQSDEQTSHIAFHQVEEKPHTLSPATSKVNHDYSQSVRSLALGKAQLITHIKAIVDGLANDSSPRVQSTAIVLVTIEPSLIVVSTTSRGTSSLHDELVTSY
jgi:hypothetical protein